MAAEIETDTEQDIDRKRQRNRNREVHTERNTKRDSGYRESLKRLCLISVVWLTDGFRRG